MAFSSDGAQILQILRRGTFSTPAPVVVARVRELRGLWEAIGDSLGRRFRLGFSEAGTYVGGSIVTASGLEIMPFAAMTNNNPTPGVHGGLMVRRWYH